MVLGLRHAEAALARDQGDAFSHVVLGRLLTLAGDVPRAIRHLSAALELNPSYAQAYFGMAQALYWAGRPADAIGQVDQALRLNPKDPLASMFMTLKSFSAYWLGDYGSAEKAARRAIELETRETWSRLALAAACEELGHHSDARAAIAEARKIDPKLTIASFDAIVGHVPKEAKDRVYAALRRAGLAEGGMG